MSEMRPEGIWMIPSEDDNRVEALTNELALRTHQRDEIARLAVEQALAASELRWELERLRERLPDVWQEGWRALSGEYQKQRQDPKYPIGKDVSNPYREENR